MADVSVSRLWLIYIWENDFFKNRNDLSSSISLFTLKHLKVRRFSDLITAYKNRRCGFYVIARLSLMVGLDSWLNSDEFSI